MQLLAMTGEIHCSCEIIATHSALHLMQCQIHERMKRHDKTDTDQLHCTAPDGMTINTGVISSPKSTRVTEYLKINYKGASM